MAMTQDVGAPRAKAKSDEGAMMQPLERGGLRARLATAADRAGVLALRAAAFPRADGRPPEWEALDDACQQVVVESAGQVLAAFRVLVLPSGAALEQSYSARFYDLAPLQAEPRPIAEMGRLCLTPDPRAWEVLRLLWGAMTRIVDAAGAGLMIGCPSFWGADWQRHRAALSLLAADHLGPAGQRPGRRGAVVDYPALCGPLTDRRIALAGLPPLLRSYLTMGGWVGDHAVADAELDTLHVFTCVAVDAVPAARAASLRAVAGD